MEKYGVACDCPHGNPPKQMIKIASDKQRCPHCGRVWPIKRQAKKEEAER